MANIIGLMVECMQHTLRWKTNKGKTEQRPMPVERSFAKQYLLRPEDPICQKCGFRCKDN